MQIKYMLGMKGKTIMIITNELFVNIIIIIIIIIVIPNTSISFLVVNFHSRDARWGCA